MQPLVVDAEVVGDLVPDGDRLSGQAPLLLVMVGYTAGGLTLLFAG